MAETVRAYRRVIGGVGVLSVAASPSAAPMIFGIGTDLCDVRRSAPCSRAAATASPSASSGRTRSRSSTPAAPSSRSAASAIWPTRFSAKEAFSKAIGLGMRMPMTWRGCEIAKRPSGKPEIRLHGALADWFATRGLRAHVSVTDEADYAASFVVVEQEPAP